jgi:hypothetical protein
MAYGITWMPPAIGYYYHTAIRHTNNNEILCTGILYISDLDQVLTPLPT